MIVSLKWLNNYIEVMDFKHKAQELAHLLTHSGLEVESFKDLSQSLNHVVVGEIIELSKHSNADKLTVCQVRTESSADLLQIVCGATNHKVKDKVVVALPKAILPGDFKIKASKIRGEESFGMLCSSSELGLEVDSPSKGILILPEDAPVGESYANYAGLDDIIFDIYITTNRADCMGHIGIARELSALLNRPLKLPSFKIKAAKDFTKSTVKLSLKDKKSCLRYSGRSIKGVTVKKSPSWLVQSLNSVGVNAINNIVDATNFVMFEYGQPLHAFDIKSLAGPEIIIDSAKESESFQTLDGTEISLDTKNLTIRDGEKPIALAGVVGGLNSGVTEETKDLFIESAYFTPQSVRRTSRKFDISTESSIRFSKGCDPEGVVTALNRVCVLIQELAGGEIANDFYDEYPKALTPQKITLRYETLERRLGYSVDKKHVKNIMQDISCEVIKDSDKTLEVLAPLFRCDLSIEMDLVEEYARINGYDKIPETLPPNFEAPSPHADAYNKSRALSLELCKQGFSQAINYHFLSESDQKKWIGNCDNFKSVGLEEISEPIKVQNPLSEELSVMRSSLFCGLFENLLHNYRNGQSSGRLFEIGPVFCKSSEAFIEPESLAAVSWGEHLGLWNKKSSTPVVFTMKSQLENIFKSLNLKVDFKTTDKWPLFLHPNQSALLFFEGSPLGYLGSLHPLLQEDYKIREAVAFLELDIGRLMRGYPKKPKLKSISKFPMVCRDVAFLIPNKLPAGDILKFIERKSDKSLQSIEIFEDYRGENVGEDEHSVSFRMTYQDSEKTLNEQDLQSLQNKIIKEVCEKFSISVR